MSMWQYISEKVKMWDKPKLKLLFDLLTLLCLDQKIKKTLTCQVNSLLSLL